MGHRYASCVCMQVQPGLTSLTCVRCGVQLLCPAGKWSSASGLSAACDNLCDAGYFCRPGSSTSNPQACGGAAVYCPAGSGLPLQVAPGYFSTGGTSAATRTATSVCVSGSNYCPGDGLMYSCPVGVYGNVSGLSSPSCSGPCEAGYFCDTGSSAATQGK